MSAVNMTMLACPADGTILEQHHRDGGRFECPRCRGRWTPAEVHQ